MAEKEFSHRRLSAPGEHHNSGIKEAGAALGKEDLIRDLYVTQRARRNVFPSL